VLGIPQFTTVSDNLRVPIPLLQAFYASFIFLVGVSTYLPLRLATEQLDSWCP